MKTNKFSEKRIVLALTNLERGISVDEICLTNGICQATLYRWKNKYSGLSAEELRLLRQLERESRNQDDKKFEE